MCQGSSHDAQARLFFPLLFPPPDIKTLFYAENERRQAAGGQEAALTVNIPQWCELETNYRTHQGILDSAALMVVSPGRGFIRGRGRIGMSRRGGMFCTKVGDGFGTQRQRDLRSIGTWWLRLLVFILRTGIVSFHPGECSPSGVTRASNTTCPHSSSAGRLYDYHWCTDIQHDV